MVFSCFWIPCSCHPSKLTMTDPNDFTEFNLILRLLVTVNLLGFNFYILSKIFSFRSSLLISPWSSFVKVGVLGLIPYRMVFYLQTSLNHSKWNGEGRGTHLRKKFPRDNTTVSNDLISLCHCYRKSRDMTMMFHVWWSGPDPGLDVCF